MALVHQPIPPFVTSRYNKSNTASSSSSNGVNTRIRELDVSQTTHHTYMVSFYNDRIYTVVTQTASIVDEWISKIYYDFHDKLNNLVVGLDCEWRVNFEKGGTRNKIAVLQLCKFIFVGVGVGVGVAEDGDKLFEDYGLSVARTIDLRTLAAEKLDFEELEGTGLKGLAFTVLRRDLPKPKNVTLSRWDASLLTYRQIQYACLDAFVSFKLGIVLMRGFKGNLYHLFQYSRNQRYYID
ncbi:Werner Syndrome-like exonuclease [Papaver somniferum]|uniref:Werner Syndrome-like exonuclease n=1 Tax=Papaver somniferum TaxID=3469 RepID=UPI000E70248D|nr:Werner Syndrome-like exonuclease [Papaver somniferum]